LKGSDRIHPAIMALRAPGFSVDGDAQKLLGEGTQGCLQKPYATQDLTAKAGDTGWRT
jgi:hypothetical protein